jgi:hypothetical protein
VGKDGIGYLDDDPARNGIDRGYPVHFPFLKFPVKAVQFLNMDR